MFRPPHSLDPPAAPTAGNFFLGGRAVYTAQNPVGYLPRAAASLHARIGQLAWLDSHQLECSLVGCSRTRWIPQQGFFHQLHDFLLAQACLAHAHYVDGTLDGPIDSYVNSVMQ